MDPMTSTIDDDTRAADDGNGDPRPVFDLTQQEPAAIADQVWDLLAAHNHLDPELFMTGDGPRRLEENPRGGALLQPLTAARLGDSVRSVARFVVPRGRSGVR